MNAPDTQKSLAQVAYETFLVELAQTDEGADEVKHAPPWESVPAHVRVVIAESVGAALRSFAPALVPDVSPEDQSFGQVGYQAYVASTGGLNYQGLPCPEWAKLTDAIRAAWSAASVAIRSEHEYRFAGEFDLEVSREELAELVAGLDALQRADKHTAELAFPLRSRLRALLFPPEPVRQPEPAAEPDDETPDLEPSNEGEKSAPASQPPPAPVVESEVIADDALDPVKPATDTPAPERTDPAPTAEAPPPPGASEGNVVASAPIELPAVSEAPPAPGLPGLEPVAPSPPASTADTDTPSTAEPPTEA